MAGSPHGHKDFSQFLENAKNEAENYSGEQLSTDRKPQFEQMPVSQQISIDLG